MLIHITDVDDVCCFTRCTRDNIVVCSYIKQTETMCVVVHVIHEAIQLYAHTYNRCRRCVLFYTLYTRLYSCMLIYITDVDDVCLFCTLYTMLYSCMPIHITDIHDVCCFTRCTRGNIVACSYIKQMQTMCVVLHVVHEVIQLYTHT